MEQPASPAADQSTPALRAAKLNGLVARFCGLDSTRPQAEIGDSGVATSDRGFYLADSVRSLGSAIAWGRSKGLGSLVLFAEGEMAGHLARRARLLNGPLTVEVVAYQVDIYARSGQLDLVPAVPGPVDEIPELRATHLAYIPVMVEAGARPADDFGRLIAEVEGLEVARVTGAEDNPDDTVLEVGVGLADRELQFAMAGNLDDGDRMSQVIAAVRQHRYPGAGTHPLARIGRQRWLRSTLVDTPELVGATMLASIPPLRAASTVLRQDPAGAFCEATNTLAVCQVGADLDLVPEALDLVARQGAGHETRLVLVVPQRDRQLVSTLAASKFDDSQSLEIFSAPEPWSTIG